MKNWPGHLSQSETEKYFEWIIKKLSDSAFVRYEELEVDNIPLDLHNSSYYTKAESNNC